MEAFVIPILASIVLFILGFFAGRLSKGGKKIGRFVINTGDPKKSAFWLELDHDLDVIEKQGQIILSVTYHEPPIQNNADATT